MASTRGPVQESPNRREIKRQLLILMASVVVLDAGIIGLYYAAHIQDRPVKTQQTFVAVWVVLTLIVVTTMMKRIRRLRRGR
jgi:hypothetical protein